jgi:PPE-repeat protein
MAIDFSALPPDVNSALMYSGAGSGPLLAAATAYANLAAEVSATANQWESVISSLTTEQWTGTGAAAAASAAQPIVTYLTETAATLEQASTQAMASAAAYEAAFAATVPPPLIAANEAEHAALVAANVAALGMLTPQILANEAEYAAFWTQDATAMTIYSAASLTSGTLTPVTPLTTAVNPGVQSLATTNALAQPAAAPLLQAAAIPVQNTSLLNSIDSALGTPSIFNSINGAVNTSAWFVGNTIPTAVSLGHTLAGAAVPAAAVGDVVPDAGAAGVVEGTMVRSVTPMGGMGFGGGAMAGVGESTMVGKLSVPATWSAAAPGVELASATSPLGGSGWTSAVDEAAPAGMGAPGMPGMVGAGAKGAGAFSGPRYGFKPIVMPKQVVV